VGFSQFGSVRSSQKSQNQSIEFGPKESIKSVQKEEIGLSMFGSVKGSENHSVKSGKESKKDEQEGNFSEFFGKKASAIQQRDSKGSQDGAVGLSMFGSVKSQKSDESQSMDFGAK
jgi:hypothetical protein